MNPIFSKKGFGQKFKVKVPAPASVPLPASFLLRWEQQLERRQADFDKHVEGEKRRLAEKEVTVIQRQAALSQREAEAEKREQIVADSWKMK